MARACGAVASNPEVLVGSAYRWVVLGAGLIASTTYAAFFTGMAVVAPTLRSEYSLTLTQTGSVLAAVNVGWAAPLMVWGYAADRFGEGAVVAFGQAVGTCALLVAAFWVHAFAGLLVCVVIASAGGSSTSIINAVLHWFDERARATLLGIRMASLPIGGIIGAVALAGLDARQALEVLAGFSLVGAACGTLVRRPSNRAQTAGGRVGMRRLVRRVWPMTLVSALLYTVPNCVVAFLPLFLADRRGMSKRDAAAVLAVIYMLAALIRVGAGVWSDRRANRVGHLQSLSMLMVVSLVLDIVFLNAPLAIVIPVVVVGGALGMGWNALAATITSEAVSVEQTGSAFGILQTAIGASAIATTPLFALLVDRTSWRTGFASVAAVTVVASVVLFRMKLRTDSVAGLRRPCRVERSVGT